VAPGIYQSDESALLFQARCLQNEELFVRPPSSIPAAGLQFAHHVIFDGKWYGKYPFGWPAVLLMGTWTNLEWLINPLLGLLLLWITYKIGAELLPPHERGYGAVLLLFSAFFTLNCLGLMSHVLCALLLAGATLCYIRYAASKRFSWLVGMLACLSTSGLVRPFTAACMGIVLVIAAVWSLRREIPTLFLFLGCGAVLGSAAIWSWVAVNHELTGSYLRTPYAVYTKTNTVREISLQAQDLAQNLTRMTPVRIADTVSVSFPFIFLLAAYALWRGRRNPMWWLLAALVISLIAGYIVQMEDSDSPIGERYYFEAFFAVAVLAGAGWAQLTRDCRWSGWFSRALGIALCFVAAADTAVCTGWEVNLRWPTRQIAKAAAHPPFQRGLVFLVAGGPYHPQQCNVNRPNGEVLYLLDAGVQNRKEVAAQLGYRSWAILRYDEAKKSARWELHTSDSAAASK
jgi:4-amino-4-deoxy-L-arabinose transferase-like glycosyltransferase